MVEQLKMYTVDEVAGELARKGASTIFTGTDLSSEYRGVPKDKS